MKNKLIDLNNHLFAQLERLGDESLSDSQLDKELRRSKAMTTVGMVIVNNARLALDAQVAVSENALKTAPAMIGMEEQAK